MSDEPTIGKLAIDAVEDIRKLVRAEIALAKAELKASAIGAGVGAAMFALAALLVLMALILLPIAAAFLLSMVGLHPAWCFLIVTGGCLLIAAIAVLIGILKLRKIRPPKKMIESAKRIPSALKGQG